MSEIYEALLRAELDRLRIGSSDATLPPAAAQELSTLLETAASTSEPNFPLGDLTLRNWKPSVEQLPALGRRTPAAEQFRSLRARLYEYRGFGKLKTVLISSASPQEGKSFLAANIALSLARQKSSRVLLIDGDLRRGTLHKLLGAPSTPGLADYLLGNTSPLETLQIANLSGIDESSPLRNLAFIPAGDSADTIVEFAGNERFRELLGLLEPAFDWIVVDSSPVNLVPDAIHMANFCDGVVLAVRAGVTRYPLAERARAEFKNANILGVVLNASTEAPPPDYYGYAERGTA